MAMACEEVCGTHGAGPRGTHVLRKPYDINHVREKYPDAPDFLHCRLGKTISKHRQCFKYRKEHYFKLAEGLRDPCEALEEQPSTIAASVVHSD